MRALTIFILAAAAVVVVAPAQAQRSNPGGSGNDPCAAEADRLYTSMRNFEERMRVKREHIRKCRAEGRGGKR